MQKFLLKTLTFVLLCCSLTAVFGGGIGNGSAGSPNISGVINQYTPVLSISNGTCSSGLTVFSSAGFVAGDLVLVIQMEGATADITNTAASGAINGYNNAGNFEFARIFSVAGNLIQTVAPLTNNYDILGITQLIRVPQYQNPVITGPLSCLPWNGAIGGVLVLDAAGTITFNDNIDVSGKGFRGGASQQSLDYHFHVGTYISQNYADSFARKGEGIATYNMTPLIAGRGAAANGGGGGNDHNAGGGGGANGGCGGNGGYGFSDALYGPNYTICQGIGGNSVTVAGPPQKIFMGGGGGAGNADNGGNAPGGNGGGVVFITANAISGNGRFIYSNGVATANLVMDGAGGGGGGGSVVLSCSTVSSALSVSAKGGDGASTSSAPYAPHGPGGGGGGGIVAFPSAGVPANVTISSLNGGVSGLCDGVTHGSTAGCNGVSVFNFSIPGIVVNPLVTTYMDTVFCNAGTLTLTATAGTGYSWSPASGLSCTNCQSPVATVNATTVYVATVTQSSCIYIDSFEVTINPLPNVILTPLPDICADAAPLVLTGGTPSGGTWSGTGVSAGSFDAQVSGTGTFNMVYSFTDSNGCSNADSTAVTVNALPVVSFAPVSPLCISLPPFALTGGSPSGGQYSGAGVTAGIFDPVSAGVGNHFIYYSYTDANGCSSVDSITLTVYALPAVTQTSLADVCEGSPAISLTGGTPAGGIYAGTGVSGGNFDPVIAGTGTHMITYIYADTNGCIYADSTGITVNPLPLVSITPPGDVCIDLAAFPLTNGSPSGGTYTGTGITGGSFDPAVAGAGNFNITYVYTDALGCTDSALTNITVNPLPVVSFAAVNPVCISAAPFPLAGGNPAGGVYSGPGISAAVFDPANAGVGTHTVFYSYTDANSCAASDSVTITVYDLPAVTIAPVNPLCAGMPAFALTGATPAGGIYSGTGVSGSTFDPAVAGVGSHAITYSYTDTNGCSNAASENIIINPLPVVTLASFTPVCIDEPVFNLAGGAPAGGTYSGNGIVSGQFDALSAGPGNTVVTYIFTDLNGCTDSATKSITVNALPVVTLPAINPVCIASAPFVLTGGLPAGGTYSGNGITGSTFDPAAAGLGTHSVYYSYTDVNGCASSDTTTITVYDLPVVTISTVNPVCEGTPAFALSGATPAGGVYSGTGITGSTFDPAVAGTGTHTVTYSYTDPNGCANAASTNIVINALPVVTLGSFAPVCLDEPIFNLTGGTPAGGAYSGIGISSGQFNPQTAGPGNIAITYSYTDVNGCSNSAAQNIVVNALPAVALPAINPVCIASASFLLNGGSPAGGFYTGNGVTGNTFDPVAAGLGNHLINYTYTDANGCTSSDTTTITVYDLPAVTISPVNPVCNGTPAFALTGATPAGGAYSGTGVTGSTFNPAVAGIGSHTVTYSYTDPNGCANSASTNIVINALPVVTLAPFTPVCLDEPVFNLSGGTPAGGAYSGTGVVAGQFDAQTAGAGTAAVTYAYTDLNGCSNTAVQNITVNALPFVSLPAMNPVCIASAPFVLNTGTPAGGTYSGNGVTGNSFDPVAAGLGNHLINYSYTDANGCSSSDTTTVTVYDLPAVTIPSVNPVCDGTAAFALTGATPAGGVYSGNGMSGNVFNPGVAGIGSHTVTYSYTDANGCANAASTIVTVNGLPAVSLAAYSATCIDEPPVILTGGTPAGGTYSGAGISGGMLDPALAGAGLHVMTYDYTDLNGCSNTAAQNFVINALPVVTLTAFNPVCISTPAFSLNYGTPAGGTYSGKGVSNGQFDPVAAGVGSHIMYYFYTDTNGCTAHDSATVNVYDLPVVVLSSFTPVCEDAQPVLLSGGSPSGGTYTGPGVAGGFFDPSVAGPGLKNITYSYTDPAGCSNADSENLMVNALPQVTLNPFAPLCENAAAIVLTGGNPVGGIYLGTGVTGGSFDPAAAGSGAHTISYTYTDINGCSATGTAVLTVNPLLFVSAGADDTVCSLQPLQLQVSGVSTASWFPATGLSCSNCLNPVASVSSGITYIISSSDPCAVADTVSLTVVPDVFVMAGNDTTICIGEHLQLQAVSNVPAISWSGSSLSCTACPDPVAAPVSDSYYIVSATNGFCTADDTVAINVIVPDVNAGSDQQIILGESIQLHALGADSCLWSPAAFLNDPTVLSPVASPELTTVYTLTGYYKGCSDTDQVVISIIDIGDAVFVPAAFTPNNDGKNDQFGPVAYGNIQSYEMKVYNRWGNLVFISNSLGQQWDGRFNGKPVPDGTYIFYISLRRENQPVLKTGRVEVIR